MKILTKEYNKTMLKILKIADLLGTFELHLNTLEKARYHQTNPATRSQVYQPTDKRQKKSSVLLTHASLYCNKYAPR